MLELIRNIYSFSRKPEQRFLCNCKHRIQAHLRFAGCLNPECTCDGYDQTKQVPNPEWNEEIGATTLLARNDATQAELPTREMPLLREVEIHKRALKMVSPLS